MIFICGNYGRLYTRRLCGIANVFLQYFPKEIYFRMPEGGLNFWIEFPKDFDSYQLFRAAKHQQISIAPGQIFSVASDFKHCIRLSFAEPFSVEIEESIRRLGDLAKSFLLATKPSKFKKSENLDT